MVKNDIFALLNEHAGTDDFVEVSYKAVQEMMASNSPKEYISHIFTFIEQHPNCVLGMPGPLVQFAESFEGNGYEELLIESVKRCPVYYNLWMMQRAINHQNDPRHCIYIDIFNTLLEQENIDEEVKSIVREFLT
ncbi:MAG: hypothetical protein U0M12_00365 [Acutalibacteraceae bacterium]|nr:hypothetical protein [Acutalibacteraceae bacterium]